MSYSTARTLAIFYPLFAHSHFSPCDVPPHPCTNTTIAIQRQSRHSPRNFFFFIFFFYFASVTPLMSCLIATPVYHTPLPPRRIVTHARPAGVPWLRKYCILIIPSFCFVCIYSGYFCVCVFGDVCCMGTCEWVDWMKQCRREEWRISWMGPRFANDGNVNHIGIYTCASIYDTPRKCEKKKRKILFNLSGLKTHWHFPKKKIWKKIKIYIYSYNIKTNEM